MKWCEKERLRAMATFMEEMTFLWRRIRRRRRRPSLLYLMRWRRNSEQVKESVKEAVIQRVEQVKGK